MSASHITYKMPRARTVSEFTIYPFTADDECIKLQSDNHCILVFIGGEMAGTMFVSQRFNQYPRFEYCKPQNGGKRLTTPATITEQLTPILAKPTGHTVLLVG